MKNLVIKIPRPAWKVICQRPKLAATVALQRYLFSLLLLASNSAFSDNPQAVRELLQRATGHSLGNLVLELSGDPKANDWFQVSSEAGRARIVANSTSGLAYGAYHFLREVGAFSSSWEGSYRAIPEQFPALASYESRSLVAERVYLNVCAYGYSSPWWSWSRWQKEIDWMALHGVNRLIAMEGQEYVWQALWREFGVSEAQLQDYFSGPAFAPWQRMGNIEGHMPPITQAWIQGKKNLQIKILKRLKALGIRPITPAFGGYVPSAFKQLFPKATIYPMQPWSGFAKPSYWLDPKDPLFKKIAKRFIEIYSEVYGDSEYYLSDSFNEMLPPVDETNRHRELAAYGKAIYDSITQVKPDATWVMQGWMFGADKEFWDSASIAAFLKNIPSDKVRIHDIGNDRYAVWEGASAFFNKPWVLGFIHNYGASNPVYGDFRFYDKAFSHALAAKQRGDLRGYGVFPEGLENNSVVYEYLFDVPWSLHQQQSTEQWLQRYTRARYGKTSAALLKTWGKLEQAVYSTRYWQSRWLDGSAGAYLLFKRPQLGFQSFAGHPGDMPLLAEAITDLLNQRQQFSGVNLFTYDLIEWLRHYASVKLDALLQQTISAYQEGKVKQGDALQARITATVKKLNLLLGYQSQNLNNWLSSAHNYADNPKTAQIYLYNARKQITTWGGSSLKDYASKSWQGMYKDFYLPRWQRFFQALRAESRGGQAFDPAAFERDMAAWEEKWAKQTVIPPRKKPER
ncbi:MAG: alpha-N-acetylglucosaminidase, partial [Cellvibrionaceae bacterium]|nr:alpha-N-acetylglucosaminidase [Cellvibrionaceae bacterium]